MRWASGNWPRRHSVTGEHFERAALLDVLYVRHMEFRALPPTVQRLIDDTRLIPTAEMHDILTFLLVTGRFHDELHPLGERD